MNGFSDIILVRVHHRLVLEAHAHLRQMGAQGAEGLVLWAGVRTGTSFDVRYTLIPAQRAVRTAKGVCVIVGPEELHRINVWLFDNRSTVMAQLHSHPDDAYHSDTDDSFPIATTAGSLSLVVPGFAKRPFALQECAVYRLMADATWHELPGPDVARLIQITE